MAESPFGPEATNRLFTRLILTANNPGRYGPATTEDDLMPGIRYATKDDETEDDG